MSKLNKYKIYSSAITALMNNDPNGSWNEILEEVNNNYSEAIKVLYKALKCSYEEAEEYDDKEFYKAYLKRVEEIL